MTWLTFDGLVNARDVGGIPTVDGSSIAEGRLLRTDNLQDLSEADVEALREWGLTDVIDLRSTYEVESEGPGPLVRAGEVAVHHFSFLPEQVREPERRHGDTGDDPIPDNTDDASPSEPVDGADEDEVARALPWAGLDHEVELGDHFATAYLSYLRNRPESVVGALRAIGQARGGVLVHCAAGKDRTGTTVALALLLAGAEREAVIADYAASSDRVELIIERLLGSPTYHDGLVDRPLHTHLTRPESMRTLLTHLVEAHGSIEGALARIGWTPEDTAAVRAKLR